MPLIAIVTTLMLLQFMVFGALVGRARAKTGVQAPATSGDPIFERYFRVHMNTLEQLIIVIPAMWMFGYFVSEIYGAALGLLFIIGRIVYLRGYITDPKNREIGFLIGFVALVVLLLGALIAACMAYFQLAQLM